jgi:hypothetical protein
MTVGKAIFTLLLSDTDLRGIVNNRIFPEVAQQDAVLPYVVYNISSNEPSDTKREPSKMDTAQIEVNLYSTSYTECIDMATHVRAALDRVRGTYTGVNVQSIQYLGEVIDFDEAQRAYNITSDYDVRVSRTDFEIAQGSPITGVTLGELSDVDTTGVTDGQVIAYDAAAQEWQPADGTGGVTELGQLDDVQFQQGGAEDGNVLFYDGDIWTNDTLQKSQIGLGNVDNTSDVDKPVSTATQTELNAKANSADFSNVDNTSDADKPVSTATQTALNAKADTSAVPTDLNDLSDVSIVGTPAGNQALIYDATAGAFKSQVSYTNRFEDEVETGLQMPTIYAERGYSVKSEGDGIFIDPSPDTPTAGKVIKRKIYHKTGFITDDDVIGDYTLIHTFADDTAYADTVAVFDAFEEGATYGVPPFTLFQTWEEVTAAPSFTGLLNETYGSGAEAAYSTRRLNGNVTECMVIRRASDSTTTTIGFDGSGNIDEAAITTFCTGTSCTVVTWKDQSGNGNDATAAAPANEPTIYTGGAIVKENGKPAIDVNNHHLLFASTLSLSSDFTQFLVTKKDSTNNSGSEFLSYGTAGTAKYAEGFAGGGLPVLANSVGNQYVIHSSLNNNFAMTTADQQKLIFANRRGTTGAAGLNGSTEKTATASLTGTVSYEAILGNTGGGFHSYDGFAQEAIFYASDKSSVRTSIESNIGDYFTQNTPLLDTYSGAAAAYSLRLLDSTYTGAAIEVYAGTNGTADIYFNVFGELDTVALAAHCGNQDGTVRTWYDQSGNGNHATQTISTANQPKIYDGSTGVVTRGGKPSVLFTGSTQILPISSSFSNNTYLYVGQPLNRCQGFGDFNKSVRTDGIVGYRNFVFEWAGGNLYVLHNGTVYDATSGGGISVNLAFDVVLFRRGSVGTPAPDAIGYENTQYISEIVSYSTLESDANLVGISNNANAFYSVF